MPRLVLETDIEKGGNSVLTTDVYRSLNDILAVHFL